MAGRRKKPSARSLSVRQHGSQRGPRFFEASRRIGAIGVIAPAPAPKRFKWGGARMIVRIYTGHDGQTHFEDLPLPVEESHNVALQAGANLVFRCFPSDHWSDWHTAPRRQYIFI